MDIDPSTLTEVEVRLEFPMVSIEVQRYDLPCDIEIDLPACEDLRLDLSLTARVPQARLSFQQHWPAHRFEQPGRLFLVPPGKSLRARSSGGTQQSLICQLRTTAMTNCFGEDSGWDNNAWERVRLEANLDVQSPTVQRLLANLCQEARHPGFASALMCETISIQIAIELGRYFISINDDINASSLPGWRLNLIDDRLNEVSDAPTLTELAELCGISVRHLTRGFRASRGCSIGKYIQNKQIALASTLLNNGDSVKGIAHVLGFSSASSFSHAFRRATGTSPRQFRDRHFATAEFRQLA